jgi:hypothetical protein
LARFLRLRPNKFSSATDPIVANDWLRSISKDLITCECTDGEKVRFTAHLLEGPAATWWETYQVTHPVEGLDWDTFREGFHNAWMNLEGLDWDTFRETYLYGHYESEEGGVPHTEAGRKNLEGVHG